MKDKITKEKLDKYFSLTIRALDDARNNVFEQKNEEAKEIVQMVSNYLGDAGYFFEQDDYVNAFAALNYAHGWLDSGVRLKVFDVSDESLFTVC